MYISIQLLTIVSVLAIGGLANNGDDYSGSYSDKIIGDAFTVPVTGSILVNGDFRMELQLNIDYKSHNLNILMLNGENEKRVLFFELGGFPDEIATRFTHETQYNEDGSKTIVLQNKQGHGLKREEFGKFLVIVSSRFEETILDEKFFELEPKIIPHDVTMRVGTDDEDSDTYSSIIDGQKFDMSTSYEGGYTIECTIIDATPTTTVELLVGGIVLESSSVQTDTNNIVIGDLSYNQKTMTLLAKGVRIASNLHGKQVLCLAKTEHLSDSVDSESKIKFIPEFDIVGPIMNCDNDRIAHVQEKRVTMSCVLTAIPFVNNKRIRVQYEESGSSKRKIKVRITPNKSEDPRYTLTSHRIPDSINFKITLTIDQVANHMFRDYQFFISREEGKPVTSTIKLIKDPSYTVVTLNSANQIASFMTVFVVSIAKIFLF